MKQSAVYMSVKSYKSTVIILQLILFGQGRLWTFNPTPDSSWMIGIQVYTVTFSFLIWFLKRDWGSFTMLSSLHINAEILLFLPFLISYLLLLCLFWRHSLIAQVILFYPYTLCQFSLSCPLRDKKVVKYIHLSPLQWFILSCPILSLFSFHSNQRHHCRQSFLS